VRSAQVISLLFSWPFLVIAYFLLTFAAYSQGFTDQAPPDGSYIIDTISLAGNKITRSQIIYRELMFKTGDTVTASELDSLIKRSKENLINTALFNFVDIERFDSGIDPRLQRILIRVTERWYVWPIPILKISDRNFNVWWETKDFSRLSYGFFIDWRNFRGRKEDLLMRFQFGYDQLYDFQYTKPYINKKKTLGLGMGAGYWRKKETNYATLYNKQEFFKESDDFAREDIFAFGQLLLRPNIYTSHLFEFRYDHHHFSDSLLAQNENYSIDSSKKVQYLTLRYFYKLDHRDYKTYPLKGYYGDFEFIKQGLWTFKENTLDNFYLAATFRKFWELYPRIYFATGLNGKVSFGPAQPYFVLRGIGYDRDIVRSYEYFVVDARHFGILKNNIKFALIPQTTKEISTIQNEKFGKIYYALYLNVFFDAGYGWYKQDFGRETNDLQNALLLGYGAGFDFVTYYDIVIRLEFSMNFLNEAGVFLHFRAPI
jgi:outer membrane protein assembly factor BamA